MPVWADGSLVVGAVAVCSLPWPVCQLQYAACLALKKAAGSGSAYWRWHEIGGLLGVSSGRRLFIVVEEVLGGLTALAIN